MCDSCELTEEKRIDFHIKLKEKRNFLVKKISQLKTSVTSADDAGTDPLDIASNMEERNRMIAELAREEKILARIEFALRNFDDYGYCIDCGEDIGLRRLEIDPATVRCVDCQRKKEILSKHQL